WRTATQAGPVEWRLAAYTGDWRRGARLYRDWHDRAMPPLPLDGARAWASQIRTVIKFNWNPPYDTKVLESLAAMLDPAQTLLYLVNWRTVAFDQNYPDYTPHASAQALVAHAHELGFHVMLHADMIG